MAHHAEAPGSTDRIGKNRIRQRLGAYSLAGKKVRASQVRRPASE